MGNLGQLAPARSSPSLKTNSPDARTYTAGLCHPGFGSGPAARRVPVPRRTALSRGYPRDRVRSAGHGLSVSRARRPARYPRRSRQTRACEVPAKFVPAAAVTRRGRALLVRTGRKAFVGGRPVGGRLGVSNYPAGLTILSSKPMRSVDERLMLRVFVRPRVSSYWVILRCKVPLMEGWNPKRSMGTFNGEGIVTSDYRR